MPVLAAASALFAEHIQPKLEPEEYGAHAQAGGFAIGASYYARSFTSQGHSHFLSRHLVIEVGLYGPALRRIPLSSGQFTLHVNNNKHGILPVAGALAGYETKWAGADRILVQAGPVILGGSSEPRFPGDRRDVPLPRAPDQQHDWSSSEQADLGKLLSEAALPTGESVVLPVGGYLYFPFEKKSKSVKTLDLLWEGPSVAIRIKLK
jgi:hypothetical protein